MIIVSDFDGTLTLDDVTTYIWDKYLTYDWRAKLLPPTYEGRWSPLEMIGHGYSDVRVPPKELLAEIRDNIRMRPGVEALLPSWIPFTSFVGTFNEWSWRVALPSTMVLLPGEDFKSRVVADLRARHPGRQAVYIGDGRLDLTAAMTCDRIFAVSGSSLADLVRVTGRSVEEFESLDEVAASL